MPPLLQTHITFRYNPFTPSKDFSNQQHLVPRLKVETLVEQIEQAQSLIIELVGAKGRGKSSQLEHLQQALPDYPLVSLRVHPNFEKLLATESDVLFLDNIHHLRLWQRVELYRQKRVIILTTTRSRSWEYRIAEKPYRRILLKGIQLSTLKEVVQRRISSAAPSDEVKINDEALLDLILQHQDDYSAIIDTLHEEFQCYIPMAAVLE